MKRRPTAEAKHNQDERKPKQAKAKKRRKGRSKSKSRKQTKKAGAKAKAPNRLEKNNKKQTNDPVPIPKRGVDLCLLTPAWRNPDLSLSLRETTRGFTAPHRPRGFHHFRPLHHQGGVHHLGEAHHPSLHHGRRDRQEDIGKPRHRKVTRRKTRTYEATQWTKYDKIAFRPMLQVGMGQSNMLCEGNITYI